MAGDEWVKEFGPPASRAAKVPEDYFTCRLVAWLARAAALTRSQQDTEGAATPVFRALGPKRVNQQTLVSILDGELIVGMPAFLPRAGILRTGTARPWSMRQLDSVSLREQDPAERTRPSVLVRLSMAEKQL